MTLTLDHIPLDDPDAIALTAASSAEIDARYDGWAGLGKKPQPEEFAPPHGAFLVARLDGRPVGCGGLCRLDADTAEIRRVYVAPEARGRGFAKALVADLIEAAVELGYARVRLETGVRQHEALALYRGLGFEQIPCWEPYSADPFSRCFERTLSADPGAEEAER